MLLKPFKRLLVAGGNVNSYHLVIDVCSVYTEIVTNHISQIFTHILPFKQGIIDQPGPADPYSQRQ